VSTAPKVDRLLATRSTDHTDGFDKGSASLRDQAAETARTLAGDALNGLMGTAEAMQRHGGPVLRRGSAQAGAAVQDGIDALRQRTRQLEASVRGASDRTLGYVRRKPVTSIAMAALAGAALMALYGLLGRASNRE